MDGVLYDSMPLHAIAWEQAMATFHIPFTRMDAFLTEGARGFDTVREYAMRIKQDLTEEQARKIYDEKAKIFASLGEATIMPGIFDVMETLKINGFTIGVVTGSGQKPLIARILHDFNAYITPDHIVTAFDVTHGKPNPEPYLMGMQKCSPKVPEGKTFYPHETIVVENAPLGVCAGHRSGAYTIAVNTGPLPDESLLEQGANVLFHTMHELNDWLKEMG